MIKQVISERMLITEEAINEPEGDWQWPGISGFHSFARGMQMKIALSINPRYAIRLAPKII
jgi:hypothetical protein